MTQLRPIFENSLQLARRGAVEARSATHAWRAGMLTLESPARTSAILRAMDRLGQIGAAIEIPAMRYADRPGLIDELGMLTFAQLRDRSIALASRASGPWPARG